MKYEPKPKGLGGLLRSSEMARAVLAGAERGADAARVAAPVQSGELRDSIRVDHIGDSGGFRGDRVEARITADVGYAAAVHFGTAHQGAQPFLDAAIDAIEGI